MAFFLALGSMLSFVPRANSRDIEINKQLGVARHFENAWHFLSSAVNDHA